MKIFPQDMIQTHIVQHLSQGSRGPKPRVPLWELVNAILYKLKSGCQWEMLPVKALIFSGSVDYKTIFHHFRKWVKDGSWERAWYALTRAYKHLLDLSTAQFDGTHSLAKRGGDAVGYQRRKRGKTSNILLLTDRNGIVVACGEPVAGNHHDVYQIEQQLGQIFEQLRQMDIPIEGLFLNADAGFDAKIVRQVLEREGVILNVAPNRRSQSSFDNEYLFDEEMYQERFAVERTNAWIDSFRTLLIRQDTTNESWTAWHYLAFTTWLIKHRLQKL